MKKILFAIDSLSGGGAERVISLLANQITDWGYETDILLVFDSKIEYYIKDTIGIYDINGCVLSHSIAIDNSQEKILNTGVVTQNAKKSFLFKLRENISEYRDKKRRINAIVNFINKNGYQAVVSFLTSTNELIGAASKKLKAKTIISERCAPVETVINQKKGKWTLRQYKKTNAIVFQTDQAMACYPPQIRDKGVVIPNPIKMDLPMPYVGERRKEIVSFGRLDKQKNLPMLISAFANIAKEYPEYTLHLFGRGQEKEKLVELVKELGLQEKVFIDDFAKNIHEIVKDAAMYVSSSDYEGISNSMLEALAIGMPCICTDCPAGGARMAIQDEVNGLLVPVGDLNALVGAINKIIESKTLADTLSKNAVLIKKRWDVQSIAKKWLEVIEE